MIRRTLAILGFLALVACDNKPASRWDDAGAAPKPLREVEAKPKEGSAFNKFFPTDADGFKRVFTQEKTGFAEAKLQKDGKDVATLVIHDVIGESDVKAKFERASDKLDGYPLVTVGKNQSAILVKDRYQVKVSSTTLDADARKEWFRRFDLKGLASL
jgi:hypothetical protein